MKLLLSFLRNIIYLLIVYIHSILFLVLYFDFLLNFNYMKVMFYTLFIFITWRWALKWNTLKEAEGSFWTFRKDDIGNSGSLSDGTSQWIHILSWPTPVEDSEIFAAEKVDKTKTNMSQTKDVWHNFPWVADSECLWTIHQCVQTIAAAASDCRPMELRYSPSLCYTYWHVDIPGSHSSSSSSHSSIFSMWKNGKN